MSKDLGYAIKPGVERACAAVTDASKQHHHTRGQSSGVPPITVSFDSRKPLARPGY